MNNNDNNIDDILEILQKRKQQDLMNGKNTDNSPTRIDNPSLKSVTQNTANTGNSFSFSVTGFEEEVPKNSSADIPVQDSQNPPLTKNSLNETVNDGSSLNYVQQELDIDNVSVLQNNSCGAEKADSVEEAPVLPSNSNSLTNTENAKEPSAENRTDGSEISIAAKQAPNEKVSSAPSQVQQHTAATSANSDSQGNGQNAPSHSHLPPVKATSVAPAAPVNTNVKAPAQRTELANGSTKEVPISVHNEKPLYVDKKPPAGTSSAAFPTPAISGSQNRLGHDVNANVMPVSANTVSPRQQQGNVSGTVNGNIVKQQGSAPASNIRNNTPSGVRPVHNGQTNKAPLQAGVVSLNDFDSAPNQKAIKKRKKKEKKKGRVPGWAKVLIYLFCVLSISVLISMTVIKVSNDMFAFVKEDKEVTVTISEKDTLKDVAQKLKKADVIEYPWVFEQFTKYRLSKRTYLSDDFIVGEHTLNPTMNYDSIIELLCVPAVDRSIVRITIPEGLEFNEMLDLFIENGVLKEEDREEFIKQVEEFDYEYDFLTKLEEDGSLENQDRHYRFEGYLFPDTYEFYKNESPVAVIDKLLLNFESKFTDELYAQVEQSGLTFDEVITLASIVEAEGDTPENFKRIASVFYNRLFDSTPEALNIHGLQSDATTLYAYRLAGYDKKTLGENETGFVHPYNTYTIKGLPPGPICNPGLKAIQAVLDPASTTFCYFYTSSNTGATYYADTLNEHNKIVNADTRGDISFLNDWPDKYPADN